MSFAAGLSVLAQGSASETNLTPRSPSRVMITSMSRVTAAQARWREI